jgi:predicted component of type VI protein secretion system
VKITLNIEAALYRRAKAEAARRGCTLDALVEEGLRLLLNKRRHAESPKTLSALMKRARGIVESGVPDLGSNKAHLMGFGRKDRP